MLVAFKCGTNVFWMVQHSSNPNDAHLILQSSIQLMSAHSGDWSGYNIAVTMNGLLMATLESCINLGIWWGESANGLFEMDCGICNV